jgi:hypothetical protein
LRRAYRFHLIGLWLMEQQLKVTPQMLNARRGHLAAVLGLG